MTISGVLDAGYRSVSAPLGGSTAGGFQNGTATSAIIISGTEDLGGGMRALFRYEMNPDFVGGSGLTGGVLGSSAVATSNGANGYNFVGVSSAELGSVRFGRLNTASLGAWGVGSVFGTALGSGFGTNGNMYTVGSSSTSNFLQTTPTRFNGAVEYTSKNINGFTGRLLYVPKVDNSGAGSTDSTTAGFAGVNRASVTDIGLAYNKGPLNVAAAQQNHKYGANAVNALVTPGGSSNAVNGDYKLTTLPANYNMGATTLHAAYWTEKQATVASTAVPLDAVGMMVGARYTMGALSFLGSYATRDDKSTTNVGSGSSTAYANADRKILGLGVDYALSKRTALWARYQNVDPNTNRSGLNPTNSNASNDATKTTAVGIRHTF